MIARMKPSSLPNLDRPVRSLRRRFLQTAGAAALAVPAHAQGNSVRARLQFLAEGVAPLSPVSFVLSPNPPAIPPDVYAQLVAGTLQARVRARYPARRNNRVLRTQVYLAPPNTPYAAEQDPPYSTPPTISLFETYVESVIYTQAPNEVVLAGTVTQTLVGTPFGDLTGLAMAASFGFSGEGSNVTFYMLGGIAAGSHASYCPIGYGALSLK
jgi:hypothetical protein